MKGFLFAILFGLVCLLTGCSTTRAKSTGIVIVGVGQSAKYGKCEGATTDAATMNGILSQYGTPTILLNSKATKANVVKALQAAAQNDLLIFTFSGHGGSDPIGDVSGETDGKNEYLCLYNTYLLDNEIWNIVNSAKNRVLLIFDCCHSETMFRSPGIAFTNALSSVDGTNTAFRSSKVTMLCWSGCADSAYSYGDAKGGNLTNAIRDAFDKDLTYGKMWIKVRTKVPSYQIPRKTEIGSWPNTKVFR